MTTSRNRLHQNKLQAFTDFCKSEGWQSVPTKGDFEVLRMRHPDNKDPLLVYRQLKAKEHLTTHGVADKMVDKFLGHRTATDESSLKPMAEHASEDLPWN